jgi:hypothetical protein
VSPCVRLLSQVVSLPAHVVHEIVIICSSREALAFASTKAVSPPVTARSPVPFPVIVVVCDGWVNPMELTRLDGPLAELIPPRVDPARFDATQDGGFRPPDRLRGLP